MATDTGLVFSDKAVLAVVDRCDAITAYDPPVEASHSALLPVHGDPGWSIGPGLTTPGLRSPASPGSTVGAPDDFSVRGSLIVRPVSDDVVSVSEAGLFETSTIGPSLVDSDDEKLASLVPGYLNIF